MSLGSSSWPISSLAWRSAGTLREFFRPRPQADIAAIVSFLAPWSRGRRLLAHPGPLRLLRAYRLVARLRQDSRFFRRNEEVIFAGTNLFVFIFVMTAIVYEFRHHGNPL